MLNKFKTEFKELLFFFFSYFFTEISHSCFSRILVKVYILIARIKEHKRLVSWLCFHSLSNIDQTAKSILSFQNYTIANSFWVQQLTSFVATWSDFLHRFNPSARLQLLFEGLQFHLLFNGPQTQNCFFTPPAPKIIFHSPL